MSLQSKFYSEYQASNPEKFNDEFLKLRENEDIEKYVDDFAFALNGVEGIEYKGCQVISDPTKFPKKELATVEKSNLLLVKIHFNLKLDDQEKDIVIDVMFPKLQDNFYFHLNGSDYVAIWQIVDRATYSTSQTLSLKSLLMPIVLKIDLFTSVKSVCDKSLNGRNFVLNMFKKKQSVLRYFLSVIEIDEILEYLIPQCDSSSNFFFASPDNIDEYKPDGFTCEKPVVFNINKHVSFVISEDLFEIISESKYMSSMIVSMINAFDSRVKLEDVYDTTFWVKKLGALFTNNASKKEEKAQSIIRSLLRTFDENTKRNLNFLDDMHREDIFSVLRWMMMYCDELHASDNMSLENKRLRLYEYIINPLLMRFSEKTYHLVNTRKVTFEKLEKAFSNIPPNFVIKRLVKGQLLRYCNAVNTIDLFNAGTKFSMRGPQSIASSAKTTVAMHFRGLHPSYVGRLELSSSSSSDPGLTGTITPFIKTDGLNFSKDMTYGHLMKENG